jgi:hypothetical protein
MFRRILAFTLAPLAALAGVALFAAPASAFDRSNRVFLVGDSTLAAMRWYHTEATLAPYDAIVDAESCRRVIGVSCRGREGYTPANALQTLQARAADLGDTVVAMIGYDDSGVVFGGAVDQFMALTQQLGVKRVIWLTFMTDVSYVGPTYASNDTTYLSNNRILAEKAQLYGDRLVLADWDAEGHKHPTWFERDGVHLTLAGATGLGGWLRSTLDQIAPGRCSTNAKVRGETAAAATTPLDTTAAGAQLVAPRRLVDTRAGDVVEANRALRVPLAGIVPGDATSVLVNLTSTNPCTAGFLTAYGCDQPLPVTSNVNVASVGSRATMAVVPTGGGDLCVYTKNRADVVVDLFGYTSPTASGRLQAIAPTRLADTRFGNGADKVRGALTGGKPTAVQTAAVAGRPAGATGVALTVTGVAGRSPGWVAAFPCDAPALTSVVNVEPGEIVANTAFVKLAADGTVCVQSNVAVDVVLDVNGWVAPAGDEHRAQAPTRLVDTRTGTGGVKLADGATLRIDVPGKPKAAVLSVTAVESSNTGFLTVYPCAQGRPTASNLNVNGRDTRANLVVSPTSDGAVCVYAQRATDLVVDQFGTVG